jgi:hypothetical protein
MNIKELAVQAGLIVGEYNGFNGQELTPAEKRFAELILEEVFQTLIITGQDTAVDILNEHFGVEE